MDHNAQIHLPADLPLVVRPLQADDLEAILWLIRVAATVDADAREPDAAIWQARLTSPDASRRGLLLLAPGDQPVAYAWVDLAPRAEEIHAFLEGRVHPRWRGQGIGRALLAWMEAVACQAAQADPLGRRPVYRVLLHHTAPDTIRLLERAGYRHDFTEWVLRADLRRALPAPALPAGFRAEPWTPANAPYWYPLYREAFRTRTERLWSREQWTAHFADPEDPTFRPELSFLVWAGRKPVAYAICHAPSDPEAPESEAWVAQLGVHPDWRRRGLGGGLLGLSLAAYRRAGYHFGMIAVNVDNPEALGLYQRAGFRQDYPLILYRKEADPHG